MSLKGADFGILFVHGIGDQKRGEPLLSAAGPLIEWLQRQPENQLGVTWARLKGDPAEPAHALIEGKLGGQPIRFFVAESWWAEDFDSPPPFAFARWLHRFGTWILVRSAAELIADWIWVLIRRPPRDKPQPDSIYWVRMLGAFVVGAPYICFVAVGFQVLVSLLAILSLVPIFKVSELAGKALQSLAAIIGDSYIYAGNDITRRAINARIALDLDWAKSFTTQVAVVAHSQGAAAALDTVRLRNASCSLITYGSGIRKLIELRQEMARPRLAVLLLQLSWIYPLGLIWAWPIVLKYLGDAAAGSTAPWPLGGMASTFIFFGYLGLCMLFLLATDSDPVEEAVKKEVDAMEGYGGSWTDLVSTADPVPAGLLLRNLKQDPQSQDWIRWDGLKCLKSAKVWNQGNFLTDHTSYWQSHDDFIPRVFAAIASDFHLPTTPVKLAFGQMIRRRSLRCRIRLIGHTLLFALTFVLFIQLGYQCHDALQPIAQPWLEKSLSWLDGFTARVTDLIVWLTVFAIHMGGLALFIHLISGAIWRVWDKAVGAKETWRSKIVYLATGPAGFVLATGTASWLLVHAINSGNYGTIPDDIYRFFYWLHGVLLR